MSSRSNYMRTETLISVLINSVLSLAFAFLVFHGHPRISILGVHGMVLDMAPQTFMVTLMACLVPGLLTRSRHRTGALAWRVGGPSIAAGHVAITAIAAAFTMTALVVGLCWLALPHLLPGGIGFTHFVIAKVLFGAALAAGMTPWAIARITR